VQDDDSLAPAESLPKVSGEQSKVATFAADAHSLEPTSVT